MCCKLLEAVAWRLQKQTNMGSRSSKVDFTAGSPGFSKLSHTDQDMVKDGLGLGSPINLEIVQCIRHGMVGAAGERS